MKLRIECRCPHCYSFSELLKHISWNHLSFSQNLKTQNQIFKPHSGNLWTF